MGGKKKRTIQTEVTFEVFARGEDDADPLRET